MVQQLDLFSTTSVNDLKEAKKFIMAGNAVFTVLNVNTGNRFTYRVRKCGINEQVSFVATLTGPDNETSYSYIGTIFGGGKKFRWTGKSKIKPDSLSVRAFEWFFENLDSLPEFVKVYHEGRCGRCGKKLTVPESIISGFGPECVKLVSK